MWDVAGGVIWIYLVLTLMGLGPALYLFRNSFVFALASAPSIGLTLTALGGSYITLLDYPISAWANAWTVTAIIISMLACIQFMRRHQTDLRNVNYFIVGLSLTAVLILLPFILGELNFTIFRGNGTDSFNYMTMADYLLHQPLSWTHTANTQELLAQHPTYPLAQLLLSKTRWSTSMLLGWAADLTHLSLYRFEYGFTTLFMLMTFSCSYCFLSLLRLRQLYTVIIALAICVGFWGQFVIDIRAMSQLSTLPLILLASVIIVYKQENLKKLNYVTDLVLGLCLAALAVLYIEVLPLICLGLTLFALSLIYNKQGNLLNLIKNYALTLLLAFLALIPLLRYLLSLIAMQMHFAVSGKNNWDLAYFHWLYHNPFLGFWGFSYLGFPPRAILLILSATLTVLFLYLLIRNSIKLKVIPVGVTLSLAFFTACLGEWGYLFFNNQLWAAGKALSYAYPFIFFIMASIFILPQPLPERTALFYICRNTVFLWLIMQCSLSFIRIDNAMHNKDYHHYIGNHSYYMHHEWDILPIAAAVKTYRIEKLGLKVPDAWLTEYLIFALEDYTQVVNLNGLPDRTNQIFFSNSKPTYCVIQKSHSVLADTSVIAQSQEFSLIKC